MIKKDLGTITGERHFSIPCKERRHFLSIRYTEKTRLRLSRTCRQSGDLRCDTALWFLFLKRGSLSNSALGKNTAALGFCDSVGLQSTLAQTVQKETNHTTKVAPPLLPHTQIQDGQQDIYNRITTAPISSGSARTRCDSDVFALIWKRLGFLVFSSVCISTKRQCQVLTANERVKIKVKAQPRVWEEKEPNIQSFSSPPATPMY